MEDPQVICIKDPHEQDRDNVIMWPYIQFRLKASSDPESYTSGSVASGRASLAGQVKG
jgi:hypothetical protein